MGRIKDFFSAPFDTEIPIDMTERELKQDYLELRTYFRISPIICAVAFCSGALMVNNYFHPLWYLLGIAFFTVFFFFLTFGIASLIRNKVPKPITVLLIILLPALVLFYLSTK